MPLEITVGPPQLLIHNGETFWLSDPNGQVDLHSQKGLIFRDTRLLSTWSLFANGEAWELLNGGAIEHFAARIYLANRAIPSEDGDIPARSLSLRLGRAIDGGVHEDIDITNHGSAPVRFNLELSLRADFADLFEVKSTRLVRRGKITATWDDQRQRLVTQYVNADFRRAITVEARADSRAANANGRLSFEVALAPGAVWHACLLYSLDDDGESLAPPPECIGESPLSSAADALRSWRARITKVETPNAEVARTIAQALDDLAALRLPVDGHTVVAAGLPWFLALFGRDSIIAALQSLPATPEFARGALAVLGARQATALDPARDAEPGKILHELRRGELAHFRLIPHTPYYGTADATALWLILLHRTWQWTAERALLEQHLPTAERCLAWLDDYGDRDGDGFQEYGARGPAGYENMGWKDAADAVLHADGTLAEGPKALCELQAYAYAAWAGMAEIYTALGRAGDAAHMREKAAAMAARFNAAFWMEEEGTYAFGLDGHKRPIRSIVSNAGHCLWAGIVPPERAPRVVARLMAPDMFSGWGIRTLSTAHPAYNPFSYHNGSVWPHDNGFAATGMRRYGCHAEAARLAAGLWDAASFFALHQVPELFAGLPRGETGFPVQCLGANVPQAWAAGASLAMLDALLGFATDPATRTLHLAPHLPEWLPELTLRDVELGAETFSFRLRRAASGPELTQLTGTPGRLSLAPRP
jgi:glycogen debranching enzyme